MKKITMILVLFSLIISCNSIKNKTSYDYSGYIVKEIKNTDITYDENYSNNNVIYKIGKKFTFSYYYENTDGEKFLIKQNQNDNENDEWEFISINSSNPKTLTKIVLEPISGNPFERFDKNYNQTGIKYTYLLDNDEKFTNEITGVIENEINVWMHPPRNLMFKILELNPFPFVKTPYKKGNNWNWKLEIGDFWGDYRWKKWEGQIVNLYQYEIINKRKINTKLGYLKCYVVKSTAESKIGKTSLISYFNEDYGFVKLEYTNIDNSKLVLNLEEVN